MYGAKVRLRYAGFVSFFSMLFSILTGLFFIVIVTRKLPLEDFGLWQVISTTIAYLTVATNIVGYWIPRFIARGENAAKSGLAYNLAMGVAATAIYIAISYILSSQLNLELYFFLISTPQILLTYISMVLDGINAGYAPQHLGYSFTIFEVTKVATAYYFVVLERYGLTGAILSVIIAQALKTLYLSVVTYPLIKESKIKTEHFIRFTKLSWIPLYCNLADYIHSLDVYIVVYFVKNTLPVALFRAAYVLSNVVFYSAAFSSALYPRMLAKKERKDVEETLRLTLMFATPLSAAVIVMRDPFLCIFGTKYIKAHDALLMLTAAFFFASLSRIFKTVILGAEETDLKKKAGIRDYLKSSFFILPTARYIVAGGYIALLSALLSVKILDPVIAWSTAFLASRIALATWEHYYSRKMIAYKIPYTSLAKYVLSSTIMALTLVLLKAPEATNTRIFPLLIQLAPYIIVGAAVYFTVLLSIDDYSRSLAKRVLNKIRAKLT